jgi:hypothetical protein
VYDKGFKRNKFKESDFLRCESDLYCWKVDSMTTQNQTTKLSLPKMEWLFTINLNYILLFMFLNQKSKINIFLSNSPWYCYKSRDICILKTQKEFNKIERYGFVDVGIKRHWTTLNYYIMCLIIWFSFAMVLEQA